MPPHKALVSLAQRSAERDPVTVARDMEAMGEGEVLEVLKAVSPATAARILPHLPPGDAAKLLSAAPTSLIEAVVTRLTPEQTAAILLAMDAEARKAVLDRLPEALKGPLRDLLQFPENSTGRIMTTDVLALHGDMSVKDAIQRIRAIASKGSATTYAYVVDGENRLLGVLNMRDLVVATGDTLLAKIIKTDVLTIDGFMDREDAAHLLVERKFFAVPVIDAERHLLGVVRAEQLLSDVREEASEDILKMVGAGSDERANSPLGLSIRKRLPWLHINLVTAFLAASVVALFQDIIAKVTVLAVLLPVVAGQGGNAGAQSLAVVMRGLVMREIRPSGAWKVIFKEGALGAAHGLIIGVVTALVTWMWNGNPFLGVVIGLGMLVNLTAAGLAGAAIPLGMKALGFDPAQSSNIILTTVTDVVGFFSFLGFAVLFRHYLI